MKFFLIMFFIYLLATGYWIRLMRKHLDNKVSIHNYFLVLFVVTCIDCAILFLEYDIFN